MLNFLVIGESAKSHLIYWIVVLVARSGCLVVAFVFFPKTFGKVDSKLRMYFCRSVGAA